MDRLEITIIPFSKMKFENFTERFDSEYFQKEYLQSTRLVQSKNHNFLDYFSNVKGGKRLPLGESFSIDGAIPYIRAEDIKSGFADYKTAPRISTILHKKIEQYQTKYNDVLLTIVGNSIGDVSIVKFNIKPCNLTENCCKIINLNSEILPEFLFSFLKSKYGQHQIKREKVGTAQPKLAIERIEKFRIPILEFDFQKEIKILIDTGYSKIETSEELFEKAQQTLLSELNLSHWKPTVKNTAIKKFSNVESDRRLDAEYYQPKYDELFLHLSKTKHSQLHQLVDFKKSIEPGSEAYQLEGIPFIRVSDISKFGISHPEHHLDRTEFDIEELKPKKDTILLTKDGSVGIAYKVDKDLDVITSGALLHLTLKNDQVLPDYLTLVLNSTLTQMQAERDAGGSIIQHWRPDQIKKVVIPVLPIDKQKELVKQIQNSFKLREESRLLIDKAKRAVEIAIEENEASALEYLNGR